MTSKYLRSVSVWPLALPGNLVNSELGLGMWCGPWIVVGLVRSFHVFSAEIGPSFHVSLLI